MTPDLLREYVQVMRETGVLAFEAEGVKIALGPPPAQKPAEGKGQKAPKKVSYNDLLFAASEGLPEGDE